MPFFTASVTHPLRFFMERVLDGATLAKRRLIFAGGLDALDSRHQSDSATGNSPNYGLGLAAIPQRSTGRRETCRDC